MSETRQRTIDQICKISKELEKAKYGSKGEGSKIPPVGTSKAEQFAVSARRADTSRLPHRKSSSRRLEELAGHRAFSGLLSASQLIDMRLSATATACFAPTSLTTAAMNRWGALGTTLHITALGRQEEWEDSPEGYPQTPPYQWWNYHDAHGTGTSRTETG